MTFMQEPSKLAYSLAARQDDLSVCDPRSLSHLYATTPHASQRASTPSSFLKENEMGELDLSIAEEDNALWAHMKPLARPSFTTTLLRDLNRMGDLIDTMLAGGDQRAPQPFNYFVLASKADGVYNLGGDLPLFAEKIRTQDREGLRRYAYACVDIGHAVYSGFGNKVITIGLVQGDALGGGMEAAMFCDVLIAERQAKFGLPEVLFNLFPGMGAYSLLSRRVGQVKAEEIILSGRTYTAEEMHALGVVDLLAEPGQGEAVTRDYIARNRTRRSAQAALYKVRRRVNPVTLSELRDVTDTWVDTALALTEQDLRRMCRIAAAQDRFRQRNQISAASRAC